MINSIQRKIGEGQITHCGGHSGICHYNCCCQADIHDVDFGTDNAILLYPGEFEAVSADIKKHILIVVDDFNGGKLGYCDRANFDQAKCDSKFNFKPLDCQSYPFAPAISGNHLTLLVDNKRCPLSRRQIEPHYGYILGKWMEAHKTNPAVMHWIKKLNLRNYEKF